MVTIGLNAKSHVPYMLRDQSLTPRLALRVRVIESLHLYLRGTLLFKYLFRVNACLPLPPFPGHISLAPFDRDNAPKCSPQEGDCPGDAIGPGRWDLGNDRDNSKGYGEYQSWDGPEPRLNVNHPPEARTGLVTGGQSFTVGSAAASINRDNVFDEVVYAG